MDGIDLDEVLGDVVYKHDSTSQITSFKKFKALQAPNIEVTMNVINGITFTSFLTVDTEQTFHASKLFANVTFERLILDGLFNFVNITELDMNAIKLFGEQFTDAELVFADGDYLNIDATEIQALNTINKVDVSFLFIRIFLFNYFRPSFFWNYFLKLIQLLGVKIVKIKINSSIFLTGE